jgi:hypothetical protein
MKKILLVLSFLIVTKLVLAQCNLLCPSNITTSTSPGLCGAAVNYNLPVYSGNCGQKVISNVITNGSFENNYDGWHLFSSVGSNGTFGILAKGQTVTYGGLLFDYADNRDETQLSPGLPYTGNPTEGNKLAIFLQNEPATHRMYQDITLPDMQNMFLSFDLQYANHSGIFDSTLQFFSVVLRDPSTDAIIGTLFKTKTGDPLFMPMTKETVSLADYAGKTVRLDIVYASINLYHLDILLDNIILFSGIEVTQTAGLPSGSTFPTGSTLNEFSIKGPNGESSTCSFTVTVTDNEKPVISVPPNIAVNNDKDKCGAIVTYTSPYATDNCGQGAFKGVIINGSFENNYNGWHLSGSAGSNGTFGILTKGQTIEYGGSLFDYADNKDEQQLSPGLPYTGNPTEGNKLAIFLQNQPATLRMYQDITLPNAANLLLSFDLQYRNHAGIFDSTFEFFSVVLREPSTDAIIATLYKTKSGDPLIIPMTTKTVSLAAYAGKNVRLEMVFASIQLYHLDILLDNIVLSTGPEVKQTAGLPSGTLFPIGTTTNTFEATDASGNSATSSFTVTVTDNQAPVITTVGDMNINNDPHQCGAVVQYETPTYTDICGQNAVRSVITNGGFENNYAGWHLSSSINSLGTFGILAKGQTILSGGLLFDYADNINEPQSSPGLPYTGNPTEGNSVAIFLQNGPATHRMYQDIRLPRTGSLELSFDLQYRNHFGSFNPVSEFFSVVLRDPVTDSILTTLFKTQPGDPLSIPMTTKKVSVAQYAGRKVRLDMIYASLQGFYMDILLDNINIPGDPIAIVQTSGLPSGSSFPIGLTTNTFEVTDAAGNTATSSFTVKVTDNEKPVIITARNIKVNNDPHQCGAIVHYEKPLFTDNCMQDSFRNVVVNGGFENNYAGWHLSSSTNSLGTFGILSKGQTIVSGGLLFDYADNINEPQSSPGLPYTGNPTEGNSEAILLQNGPAIHRMYQDVTLPRSGPLVLNFDLQYRNHSGSFNPVSEFFSVVLRDPVTDSIIATLFKTQIGDPLIIPMTTKTVSIAPFAGRRVRLDMIYANISNFFMDILLDNINIPGDPIAIVQTGGLPSGSTFPIGTTTNTYEVTDASGNTATGSFTVKVTDNTKPDLYAPSDILVNADPGTCSSSVDAGTATALDNCTDVRVTSSRSDHKPLESPYPVGITIITWKATDASGNSSVKLQLVIVKDNEPPLITNLSADPSQLLSPDHQLVDVNINYQLSDNCNNGVVSILSVRSNEPVSGTGPGDLSPDWKILNNHKIQLRAERSQSGSGRIYIITVTAIDLFGNITNESVQVTVPNVPGSEVNTERKTSESAIKDANGLEVKIMPNPAVQNFTLITRSNNAATLTIRVADVLGRIIETKQGIAANGTIRLGDNYSSGVYYLEVLQGNQRINIKLLKQHK